MATVEIQHLPTDHSVSLHNTSPSRPSTNVSSSEAEYKLQKHRLEKLDHSITELPKSFDEWLNSLSNYCKTGAMLASQLELVLEDTPLLIHILKYRETCELMADKCKKQEELLKPEFAAVCKKVGPTVGSLRSNFDLHAKLSSKYESAKTQLENISNSDSKSKAKVEQADMKYKNALQEFTEQDTQLSNAIKQFDTIRVETIGNCFLSMLEAQSQFFMTASNLMLPLTNYKDIGKNLIDPQTSSSVKEATLNWLASAQVYRNLRTFGSLSRNDVQCLTSDYMTDSIRKTLNNKVDSLLKSYMNELKSTIGSTRKVLGGFHLNSKGVELALKDCCTSLEALGAGAPLAVTRTEKEEQIEKDIPRTVFHIGAKHVGGSTRDLQKDIQNKLEALEELVLSLPAAQKQNIPSEKIDSFAFHVLNESCTTVTSTASKISVQLVYGKANLVSVRPSVLIDDIFPVEITAKTDSSLSVSVKSIWCVMEDSLAFSSLSRLMSPDTYIAVVKATYIVELDLIEFVNNTSDNVIPTITVKCEQINKDYFSSVQHHGLSHSRSTRAYTRKSHHIPTSPDIHTSVKDDIHLPSGRLPSSDAESVSSSTETTLLSSGTSPLLDSSSGRSDRGSHGSSIGRSGVSKSGSNLQRSISDDSISTATTVKASNIYDSEDITSILPMYHHGLTQRSLMDHTKSETRPSKRYSSLRKEQHWIGDSSRSDLRREEQSGKRNSDKNSDVGRSRTSGFTPATPADFDNVFEFLGRKVNPASFNYKDSYYLKRDPSDDERTFLSGDKISSEDILEQSQIVDINEVIRSGGHCNPHLVSDSTASLDSGIVMPPRGNESLKRNGRPGGGASGFGLDGGDESKWSLFSPGFGPFYPPVSSDSDSESASGRNSRDTEYMLNFRSSHDDIPDRSASSASFHSGIGRPSLDSDSLSLPDERDYQIPFNQAPGSHRGHRRHPSSSSNTYEPTQDLTGSRSSFSQEIPMPRSQEDFHHHAQFPNSYDHEIMRPLGGGPSQFLSDPYPGPPPPFPPHHTNRYIGPMHRPPPTGPRPPFWDGYGGGPGHMMGPPPAPRGPPHPHPPDMYRPPHYRTNTPDMSPAPSPHPTPPTTPPPSHHPSMMGMPSPMRMGSRPHPPPCPHRPHPQMRPEFDFMHHGPPPGPPPRGIPPMGVNPMGPHPHQHGHGPHPPPPNHMRMPPPSHMPDWGVEPPWRPPHV